MPIRADQLQEKKDYQKLILEELRDRNGYVIRNAQTDWSTEYAMDTGLLFKFIEDTQPEAMAKLRKFYNGKTEKAFEIASALWAGMGYDDYDSYDAVESFSVKITDGKISEFKYASTYFDEGIKTTISYTSAFTYGGQNVTMPTA